MSAPSTVVINSFVGERTDVGSVSIDAAVTSHLPSHVPSHDDETACEIRTLNGLIVGTLDNIDEYRRAIFALEQRLDTFQRGVYNRMQAVEHLQSRVRALGGQPATTRSTLAAAFAALLAVRHPFVKDHEKELIHDVERGTAALHRQFKACLGGSGLSETGRHYVDEAFERMAADRKSVDSWNAHCNIATSSSLQPPLAGGSAAL